MLGEDAAQAACAAAFCRAAFSPAQRALGKLTSWLLRVEDAAWEPLTAAH